VEHELQADEDPKKVNETSLSYVIVFENPSDLEWQTMLPDL